MRVSIMTLMTLAIVSTYAYIPKEMKDMMDKNVKACDDFYQHACGGWLDKHTLKPSETRIDASFERVDFNNEKKFWDIIAMQYNQIDELYESCMDVSTINSLGNRPLQKDLKKIVDADSKEEIFKLVGEFSRTGTKAIIMHLADTDVIEGKFDTLYLLPADLTLPRPLIRNLFFSEVRDAYPIYIKKMIKLSGFSLSESSKVRDDLPTFMAKKMIECIGVFCPNHHRSMDEIIIEFEKKLVDIHTPKEITLNDYQKMKIEDAKRRWPLTVNAYLKGLRLSAVTHIYMQNIDYFDAVEKEIQEEMELNDLKVYLAFAMVHSRVEWLGDNFYNAWFDLFGTAMDGRTKAPARYRTCKDKVVQYLPDLMAEYYSKKSFGSSRQKSAEEMMKLIKEAMKGHIADSTWLTINDKKAAHNKLEKVVALIGKPKKRKPYPTLSHSSFYNNIYSILSSTADAKMMKVGKLVDRDDWFYSPVGVNAHYSPFRNAMLFPATILQPPFFSGEATHPARNFGGIGTIMGHELTHGFDTKGRQYDGDGMKSDWWSEQTVKTYTERANCIKEQYSTFIVEENHQVIGSVNGNLTLNENIADIGGVALAWDAYKKYTKTHGPTNTNVLTEEETRVKEARAKEGDKMFFLAFGQIMCRKTSVEAMSTNLFDGSHAPNKWRVNGAVMNNPDFAQIFGCKDNSPMNPKDKCQLW